MAGGIFNRDTALRAAMMGAAAIQVGTAYLATQEIVATGALSPLYQRLILEAKPGATALSGETIGLRVRSLKTPKMDAILALEREFVASNEDESAFRRRLETLSAKSLLIAARGQDQAAGSSLNEETCLERGQFMSGAVSGMINRVVTIAELHQELAVGPLQQPLTKFGPSKGKVVRSGSKTKNGRERVAITGMALVNSLGNTPGEIWENVLALKSGITEVPPSRWDYNMFYEPRPGAKEKTYCKVGAFKNVSISRRIWISRPKTSVLCPTPPSSPCIWRTRLSRIRASWIPTSPGSVSASSSPRIRENRPALWVTWLSACQPRGSSIPCRAS